MWAESIPDEPINYSHPASGSGEVYLDCCVCGDTVTWAEWSDASTCCKRHLMPTELMEDEMYELAKSADRALGRGRR